MNVDLTPELEKLVEGKVESGQYNSASEVVRDALRLMESADELRGIQLQQIRDRIEKGLDDVADGRVVDGETFTTGLLEELDTRAAKLHRK